MFKTVGCEPVVAQDLGLTGFDDWFRPAAALISLLLFVLVVWFDFVGLGYYLRFDILIEKSI